MRFIKPTFIFFLSSIIIFIIFNVLLAIFWEFRTNKKFENFNPYTDTVLELLKLNKDEGRKLYIETWIDRKYEYDQFVEWNEGATFNKSFVNISNENGRKITNNDNCKKNFYFYGGSTTFGYNVTDYQTFPQYFKNILDKKYPNKNYCVFNYGRAGYASPWETFLFQKHLNKGKIKKDDFVFFIEGINERGLTDGINTGLLKSFQNAATYKYWNMYKPTFSIFWQSIPFNQLVARLKQKYTTQNLDSLKCTRDERTATVDSKTVCYPNSEIVKTFENFVKIRKSICDQFQLNCYTMLQPFSSINGNYFTKYEKSPTLETGMLENIEESYKKEINLYNLLKNVENVTDISISLDDETALSYVDRSHYSPLANKAISKYIFEVVKLKID